MWRYGFRKMFWFIAIVATVTLAVMMLWNWLIPELFNGPIINYWQAFGLLLLSKLLTGMGRPGMHHWKSKLHSGWHSLSDKERSKLREKFRDKWCRYKDEEK